MLQRPHQRINFPSIQDPNDLTHDSKSITRQPRRAGVLPRLCWIACLFWIVSLQTAVWAQTWQRLGPDYEPSEGLCYHVLPHPDRTQELLVGTRPLGLLLSTDDGKTWTRTSEEFPKSGNIGPNQESMARAPSRPDTIYAGIEKLGVRRSDDGGKTWRNLAATLPKGRARNGVSVAIHPTDPETAWLGTDGGIFKTVDGGEHWRRLTEGLPTGKGENNTDVNQTIAKILIDTENPDRLWLGMYASGLNEPAGVWRSNDGGESWSAASAGIDTGDQTVGPMTYRRDWVMGLARCIAEPKVFFVSTPFAVYRSEDGARSWVKLPHEGGAGALAIHPRDPKRLFLAIDGGRVKHSRDAGHTWSDLSDGLRLGREPNAPVYRVNFVGPDGKTQVLEGTDSRFVNKVASFRFDPRDPDILYAAAHAGVYRLDLASNEAR